VSDTAQLLVAIDCPADEAELQARRAVDSLVDGGVIASETPDAVWGRVGHAPGPAFPGAVEGDIGTRPEFWAMPDGVEVETGRSFVADPSFEMSLHCPRCVTTFDTDPDEWGDAAMKWLDGDDATYYACRACGYEQPLAEWDGPHLAGFGYLALHFWNWPPLKPEIVQALSEVIGGRIRVVWAKS